MKTVMNIDDRLHAPMKIVVAIDSFKGSLTSYEAGEAAGKGIKSVLPKVDVRVVRVADGGEGTLEAMTVGADWQLRRVRVIGPMGKSVEACYGLSVDSAVIETATACGLTLIPERDRNPWKASSYGVGELICDAIARGCRKFYVGLGGSGVNDGGIGMLRALGFRFLTADGREIAEGMEDVVNIFRVDSSRIIKGLQEAEFIVACDVTNPLTGPHGASYTFGEQKGADRQMMKRLDESLTYFSKITEMFVRRDYSTTPGAGAAGGLGFAMMAYLGAKTVSGAEMVLNNIGFDETIAGAQLIITGEGCLDSQTCMGKAPYVILQKGLATGIPVIAIGGCIRENAVTDLMESGFKAVFPIVPGPMSLESAMNSDSAKSNITRTVSQIMRLF